MHSGRSPHCVVSVRPHATSTFANAGSGSVVFAFGKLHAPAVSTGALTLYAAGPLIVVAAHPCVVVMVPRSVAPPRHIEAYPLTVAEQNRPLTVPVPQSHTAGGAVMLWCASTSFTV